MKGEKEIGGGCGHMCQAIGEDSYVGSRLSTDTYA